MHAGHSKLWDHYFSFVLDNIKVDGRLSCIMMKIFRIPQFQSQTSSGGFGDVWNYCRLRCLIILLMGRDTAAGYLA